MRTLREGERRLSLATTCQRVDISGGGGERHAPPQPLALCLESVGGTAGKVEPKHIIQKNGYSFLCHPEVNVRVH